MCSVTILCQSGDYVVVAKFAEVVETRIVANYRDALQAAAQLLAREVLRHDASNGYGFGR